LKIWRQLWRSQVAVVQVEEAKARKAPTINNLLWPPH
jgi:hypothetical protein